MTRLQDSRLPALRPAHLLPPKRLSTPRLAHRFSTTNRGLLPGAPVPTGAGLAPASPVQLAGRNTIRMLAIHANPHSRFTRPTPAVRDIEVIHSELCGGRVIHEPSVQRTEGLLAGL